MSATARAWPVATGAAPETKVPPEVPRQNPSRSAVHHEGSTRKAPLPIPWRDVDGTEDAGGTSENREGAAVALESLSITKKAALIRNAGQRAGLSSARMRYARIDSAGAVGSFSRLRLWAFCSAKYQAHQRPFLKV